MNEESKKMKVRLSVSTKIEESEWDYFGSPILSKKMRCYFFDFIHKSGYQYSWFIKLFLDTPWEDGKKNIISGLKSMKSGINGNFPGDKINKPYDKIKGSHTRILEI